MSGRHDKGAAADPSALHTGPIIIRGLGRGMRDTFRPGRPGRHRATYDVDPQDVAASQEVGQNRPAEP